MDALSDVLRVMRLKGGVYLHGEFCEPWCLSVKVEPDSVSRYLGDTAHIVPYHFVIEGRMRVATADGTEFELAPGESVLFPRNDLHLMGSDIGRPALPAQDVVRYPVGGGLATISLSQGGARTRIVCGFLGTEDIRGNPVVSALPAMLRLSVTDDGAREWVRSTFRYAADRIAAGHTGSEVLMGKLSELLFVDAIQRYAETLPAEHKGWLAGLRDPFVSRALALMHAKLAHPWTVEALGREIGLSRSALATRFGEVLGVPPMQYLASWRLHVAAHELVNSSKSILQIAHEVGYDSEASFTRAFKRVMDAPPATWRRQRRGQRQALAME